MKRKEREREREREGKRERRRERGGREREGERGGEGMISLTPHLCPFLESYLQHGLGLWKLFTLIDLNICLQEMTKEKIICD